MFCKFFTPNKLITLVSMFLSLILHSVGKPIWLKLRCDRRGLALFQSDKADKRNFASTVYYFRGLLNDDILTAENS